MTPARSCEVYIDGASRGNPGPAGIGVVFVDGRGNAIRELAKPIGQTTNNVAEYMALVYAQQEALAIGCTQLTVRTDSELLTRQINGQYQVRDPHLRVLHDLVLHVGQRFAAWRIEHVPRERNALADRLAGRGADSPLRATRTLTHLTA